MSELAAPRLHVVLRSYGGENDKRRPRYYSKLLCLASLLRATSRVGAEVIFVNDGPLPADRLSVMRRSGEVIAIEAGSNRASYRTALAIAAARRWDRAEAGDPGGPEDREHIVWFAEDDYLYTPDAFEVLLAGARALPHAGYLALVGDVALDLSGGRLHPAERPEPGADGDPAAVQVGGVRWFHACSTTSTFGVRAGVLREDLRLLRLMPWTGGAFDSATCLAYQGVAPFTIDEIRADLLPFGTPLASWPRFVMRGAIRVILAPRALRRPSRRRLLLCADPQPVAHMELGLMGPGTDWAALARETADWAAGHGIDAPLGVRPAR